MTLPVLVFGILFSTLLGAVFHLITGGSLVRMISLIVLSWIGFWAGHLIGNLLGWTFWSLGPLRMGMATLGSLLFLGVGFWLGMLTPQPKENKK